jgi:hypothetical protein
VFRTLIRGLLKVTLAFSLYFLFRDQYSMWLLILLLSILLLSAIKKRKTVIPQESSNAYPLQESRNADPFQVKEISEEQKFHIAVAICSSFALDNIYLVEDEIELRIVTGLHNRSQSLSDLHFGKIGRVAPDSKEILIPYEVFELLCTKYLPAVDPEFLRLITRFGWIGYQMGNLPPASLCRIEEACLMAEDRAKFAQQISNFKVSGSKDLSLEIIWNRACQTLSTFISSNQGMNAIKAGEAYWLPAFSKDL